MISQKLKNMENITKIKWENWNKDATENLTLRETNEGIFVASTIESFGEKKFIARYEIICDVAWRVKKFKIELVDTQQILELTANGLGVWSDASGIVRALEGAIDVDINVTPFTNTLPIRRLKLKENQSKEIVVVYVSIPEFIISTERQQYTCIIPGKLYRFESLDRNFIREIVVDDKGLVLEYPGLFKKWRSW